MKVTLLAHTQLNSEIVPNFELEVIEKWEDVTDGVKGDENIERKRSKCK